MPRLSTHLERQREKFLQSLSKSDSDGPLMAGFKWFWRRRIWEWPHELFQRIFFWLAGNLDCDMDEAQADLRTRKEVEWYWLIACAVLILCYSVAFYVAGGQCSCPGSIGVTVVVLVALISLLRVGEIIALNIRLVVFRTYETRDPSRALIIGLFSYVQTSIAFATVFLADSYLFRDNYSAGIHGNPLDALYFSVVTIATLGYGDMRPETWPSKLFVLMELLVGLFLIVVVLQSVLTACQRDSTEGRR